MNTIKRGKLIAFRGDRLGARLISIFNTLRIAKQYDLPFCVHWRDSDGLEDPTEIFSENFVQKYFIDKKTFQDLRERATPLMAVIASSSREALLAHLDDNRHIIVDPVFDVQVFPFEDAEFVHANFYQAVDELALNDLLAERLAKIRTTLQREDRSIAYHIRRGDLTADRPAMNRAWPNKFVPDEFFESHMRANLDVDAKIILFSDNLNTLERYAAKFPEISTFASLADTVHVTDTQRDALELFTMASVDQIIAPPASAFSSTAKTIGGNEFADVESCLSQEDRIKALDLLTHRLVNEADKFANDGEVGQYLVYAMQHLTAQGRRDEYIALARRHIDQGMNIAFVYADVFREMFFEEQYEQICELRKRVDQGYVHFSRSYAQVLLYHGAALLMLGRKNEAIEQLTSAFWHEPVEGEIDALIGTLSVQGDLHSKNFWFTDPLIERMFTNRFALEHTQKYFPQALLQGVLRIERAIPTCRVMVWEWIDFTRSDLRKKYRFKGHFRALLTALLRHSWSEQAQPHLDSFIGLINRLEGNIENAEKLLCGAVRANETVSLFHKRVAELRIDQGRITEARVAIDKAITLEPEAAMYRALSAQIFQLSGDTVAAIAELEAVLGYGQLQFPSLYYFAAEMYREIDNLQQARQALSKALSLEPANWRRQLELARLLIELDETAEAVRVLEWTFTWADDHPPMVMSGAQLLCDAGQVDRAIALLDIAHEKRPDKAQFRRLQKKLLRQQGRGKN